MLAQILQWCKHKVIYSYSIRCRKELRLMSDSMIIFFLNYILKYIFRSGRSSALSYAAAAKLVFLRMVFEALI